MSENADRPLAPQAPSTASVAAGARSHGIGLYKSGQGYWVRMLTASCIFLLGVAGAAWVWGQIGIIKPPVIAYSVVLSDLVGAPKDGDQLKVVSADQKDPTTGEPVIVATTKIGHVSTGQSGKTVITLPADAGFDSVALRGSSVAGTGTPAFAGKITAVDGVAKFDIKWVQTAGSIAMIVLGMGLAYLLAGTRPSSVDFLVSTGGEMKKVNWSNRKSIQDSTIMVIGACFIIAGFLFIIDVIFQKLFSILDIIKLH